MKPVPAVTPEPPKSPSAPIASYAEQLAAFEARRRASDDVFLRKMLPMRDPMNPG